MKLFFEILNGSSSFEIEVDRKDTLLKVKQKIEKSQRIPVSKQTLIVDGCYILREDLSVEQCQIVQESHLQLELEVSAEDDPHHTGDQVLQPEQSPAQSVSVEDYFEMQDWPLIAEEIRKIYSNQPETTQERSSSQDSSVTVGINNQSQVLHQTEQSTLPCDSGIEIIIIPDSPEKVRSNKKVSKSKKFRSNKNNDQCIKPSNIQEVRKSTQDSPVTVRTRNKNQVLQTGKSTVPSDSGKEIIIIPDSPEKVQVPQTEQPPPSNLVNKTTNIQDSPVNVRSNKKVQAKKIEVFVIVHSGLGALYIPVKTRDHVKLLRNKLVKSQQKGRVTLPREGYFFMHKGKILNEDKSFKWNRVREGDSINVLPKTLPLHGSVTLQVPQTKQSPPSNSVEEITNIQDLPMKRMSNKKCPKQRMLLLVLSYYGENIGGMNIGLRVNTTDRVNILRNELVQRQQRGYELNLPQEGYIFIHKKEVLNEDESFEWNGVIPPDDTIEIIPRHIIRGS